MPNPCLNVKNQNQQGSVALYIMNVDHKLKKRKPRVHAVMLWLGSAVCQLFYKPVTNKIAVAHF